MRKSAFVKVSGDMCNNEAFIAWVRSLVAEYFVVICVGGGTQINEAFEARGFPVGRHGPMGRETRSFEERQVARDVLETNQALLQDRLATLGIHATVVIPVLDIGTVLTHVNGDQMVRTAYLGFDTIFVVTTPDRVERKSRDFQDLPKVSVTGIE